MIAASEPQEFVPHGRTVLENHPGKIYGRGKNNSLNENSLLFKLTNFAIKDESLLESKPAEDAEWWCVREVFSRIEDEFDQDPGDQSSTKDVKDECMSESFRPPSRLKTDFNISIKSEIVGKKTDNYGGSCSRGGSANSSSNMSKKFNLSSSSAGPLKDRVKNPKTDNCYEEELYVKGCTAVWSKGLISSPASRLSSSEKRETIACYTLETPIKHATFCNFYVSINNTMLIDALNTQIGDTKKNIKIEDTTEHIKTKIMPSILLIDNKCMRVFAKDGRDYITSIPFQVKKVWPMKYGVLLEKDATPLIHNSLLPTSFLKLNESHNSSLSKSKTNIPVNMSAKLRQESISGFEPDIPLPTCFSLSHPLDEVTPLLMKSPTNGLQYYNDGDIQIIFVSTKPSIILLYDWKLGTHSLWKLRKALRDECLTICPNLNSTTTGFSQSCDFPGSPFNKHTSSYVTGNNSPLRKGPSTPTPKSRLNSPIATAFLQQGISPQASVTQVSCLSTANTLQQTPPSLPLYPDICLDHIWTDSHSIRRDQIESSDELKGFLHTDLVGHEYLCFMVKVSGVSKLQMLRLQRSHCHGQVVKTNLIVGSSSFVLARDAVVLEHLKMIALIDEAGNIILQSGTNFVGKVHVGGVLARLIDSPYTKPSFQSPFPRRSSLLPSRCNESSLFDDSALHMLSPVPHTQNTVSRVEQKDGLGVLGIRDACSNRVTVHPVAGCLFRITLPDAHCSPLVAACSAAITHLLPKDVTMQVIIKWYGVRNAPGTQDLTQEQEWTMFSNLLFSLIGYDIERLSQPKKPEDGSETAEVATKKQRTSNDGSVDDWEYLLTSKIHKKYGVNLANILNLQQIAKSDTHQSRRKKSIEEKQTQFNTESLLLPYTAQILFALHLVYEEFKLNTLLLNYLQPLCLFLYQLAKDLKLEGYVNHYWLDFPLQVFLEYEDLESQITDAISNRIVQPSYFSIEPPNMFAYVNNVLKGVEVGAYPYLEEVNDMSRNIIEVLSVTGCGGAVSHVCSGAVGASSTPRPPPVSAPSEDPAALAVTMLYQRGFTSQDVEKLPPAISLILLSVFVRSRCSPPVDWAKGCYQLVMREDLAKTPPGYDSPAFEPLEKETAFSLRVPPDNDIAQFKHEDKETDNKHGMEHLDTKLMRLLFPRDNRISEVFNLLQSSTPVPINLTQRPDVSDHDFIEEQEKYLFAVSTRTMALPVGRGMVTLRSIEVGGVEAIAGPTMCVSGRGSRGGAVEPGGEVRPWTAFHNRAAAALALTAPPGETLLHSYLTYTKPKGSSEVSYEHAGFLMALGLNGHLKDMPFMNIYEYLVKCQEMTSIGLLLGLAATYKGTMDLCATKLMSIHLEPLLPPTSIELDIQQNILSAALMGVGLLYQQTMHAHYAHVLLQEIGKPSTSDGEACIEREGYALAAGLALGFVCVGGARSASGAHSAYNIAQTLYNYMQPPQCNNGFLKDSSKSNPGGASVNLDVTGPGATVALGLVYLGAGPGRVAGWLDPPQTPYHLDFVRPDLLMLRTIARGLILWSGITPDEEWVESQVPDTIRQYCFVKPVEESVDYEAMNQAYCNIVAGACMALGLRYAGSGNEEARDTLLHYTSLFVTLAGKSIGELAGRSTLESCMCVCLLSAGMVMAGRGDVSVLRWCRRLRVRIPAAPLVPNRPPLTHGGQMAVHSTVGLLFLGGCRYTLSTAPTAIAALLAAFFPKFPTHCDDNRYHLQAFRHLYVLAVEPRLVLPRDIDSGKLCYAHIQVVDLSGRVSELKAPCILPELETLREVRVADPRYWTVVFQRHRNWDILKKYLERTWCVDIKQRAGCLSYLDDPLGFLTLLAQTLTLDKANVWSATPENIKLFTTDEKIRMFTKHYLSKVGKTSESRICADCLVLEQKKKSKTEFKKECQCRKHSKEELEFVQGLNMVTYECVVRDVICALPVWTTFLKILRNLKNDPSSYHIWQIRLLQSQIEHHNSREINEMKIDGQDTSQNEPLISNEFTLAIQQRVENILDTHESRLNPYLRKYLGLPSSRKLNNCEDFTKKVLTSFITYYEIPKNVLCGIQFYDNVLSMVTEAECVSMGANTLSKIEKL